MPRVAGMNGRGVGPVPDTVPVGPALSVVARMKSVGHLADCVDGNIRGQNRVEALLKPRQVEGVGSLKGCHLAQRMNPCVGSSSHPHANGRIQNPGQDRFERSLNSGSRGLNLPAVIIGPVVFEQQFIMHGGWCMESGRVRPVRASVKRPAITAGL